MNLSETQLQDDSIVQHIDESKRKARSYLLGRQSQSGGFCFYRSTYLDEPNLSDTWHAVASLQLLGEAFPKFGLLRNFVCMQPVAKQLYDLYFRTFTLKTLNCDDPELAEVKKNVHELQLDIQTMSRQGDNSGLLQRLLLTLRLKISFGAEFDPEGVAKTIQRLEQPDGGFGISPNVMDTRIALDVAELCGLGISKNTTEFLNRLEGPGYAFKLTENSLSPNLETVCAGIECCRKANLPVLYALDAAKFIMACQTHNGGFARAPDALPDLGLTHLALYGLACLFDDVQFDDVQFQYP